MSLQITIKCKSLIKKKVVFMDMIKELKLSYGAYDDFSILVHNKFYNEFQAILFNPKKIGLGIFFDGSLIKKGEVTLMMQSFSTKDEISCLYNILEYIQKKFIKTSIYLNDDYVDYGILLTLRDRIEELALENLRVGCRRTLDYVYHIRLALFPLTLSDQTRERFSYAENLDDFEEFIHNKQKDKVYYAKPDIHQIKDKFTAFYTLSDECKNIFPINGNDYYNDTKVDNVLIKFFSKDTNKFSSEIFGYKKFINIFKNNEKYDDNHIYINKMSIEEIENTINKLKED